MNEQLSQTNRVAELTTPLGKDVLVLTGFSGNEGLGELFEYRIEALGHEGNLDFDKAIGKNCQVKLKAYEGRVRIFNGVLTRTRWTGIRDTFHSYKMVLRPWFWLLGHQANCRIFLNKTVLDIIKDVFTSAGFSDFEFRTTGEYIQIEYCVQYRETDLAFCLRLMEQYGVYYFFEHSDGKHTLILADSLASHKQNEILPKVPYIPLYGAELRLEPHLFDWDVERLFRTGKVEFNDYDYLNPNKNLKAPRQANARYSHGHMEVYDYHPEKYDEQGHGRDLASVRLESEHAVDHRRHIEGDAAPLFPGSLVDVERHPIASENRDYLVVRSSHRFSEEYYRSGSASAAGQAYHGAYQFLPSDHPFRMPQVTPKPKIYGIQTAKVVGKEGEENEEISTDRLGRIWVRFHWDREPSLTCPIRVAQLWAGNKWGAIFIPRVGMEVVVDFLEGDPDKPLVTGCVYNGDWGVPWDLPAKKTWSGIRTDSSRGHDGHNSLLFCDEKGHERVGLRAEKNLTLKVRDAESAEIGEAFTGDGGQASRAVTLRNGDDSLNVQAGNQTIAIAQNQKVQVGESIIIEAGTSIELRVGSNSIKILYSGIDIVANDLQLTGTLVAGLTSAGPLTLNSASASATASAASSSAAASAGAAPAGAAASGGAAQGGEAVGGAAQGAGAPSGGAA